MVKPSKEAKQIIKLLSMYAPADYMFYNYGYEAYHLADETQRQRFREMVQGFRHAKKGG